LATQFKKQDAQANEQEDAGDEDLLDEMNQFIQP
jgi:hypothetical protein